MLRRPSLPLIRERAARATERTSASVKFSAAVLGVVLVGYFISLLVRNADHTWTWLDGWGTAGFELLAGLLVLAQPLAGRSNGRFEIALGIGMCFWAAGDFAMTAETLGGATPPDVSTANILWAGFYPFAYVGVMVLMRAEVRRLRLANYLDGVMAALAVATLFAAFAFAATLNAAGGAITASVADQPRRSIRQGTFCSS